MATTRTKKKKNPADRWRRPARRARGQLRVDVALRGQVIDTFLSLGTRLGLDRPALVSTAVMYLAGQLELAGPAILDALEKAFTAAGVPAHKRPELPVQPAEPTP